MANNVLVLEVQCEIPSNVRYAMAAGMLQRLDEALIETQGSIDMHQRRKAALLRERQELIAAISASPLREAA